MKEVELIFDFASPNAYFVHKVLPKLVSEASGTLKYKLCLLGGIFKSTGNQAPMIAFGEIKGKLEYDNLESQRFINKYGLSKYKLNPHFPVNSLLLMRAALVAERDGVLPQYLEAGVCAMWEDGLKLDDPQVFVKAMNDAGLKGEHLLEGTSDPDIKSALIQNTQEAVDRGVFGIPTMFVGKEMFFGKERIGQVIEELQNS